VNHNFKKIDNFFFFLIFLFLFQIFFSFFLHFLLTFFFGFLSTSFFSLFILSHSAPTSLEPDPAVLAPHHRASSPDLKRGWDARVWLGDGAWGRLGGRGSGRRGSAGMARSVGK
jgi:hypothetical protein